MMPNATLDCLDPAYVFSSPHTLFTCFQAFGSQGYQDDQHSATFWYNGIYVNPNNTFGLVIEECIKQYCLKPDSALNGCGTFGKRIVWSTSQDHFSASGCESVNTVVNQDFSGPGVMLSGLYFKHMSLTYD